MPALSPSVVSFDDDVLPAPRERNLPTCPICLDTMIAAEASAFDETGVSYLWNCEICGCGFVTKHQPTQYACL
jgi:hypothetical protein